MYKREEKNSGKTEREKKRSSADFFFLSSELFGPSLLVLHLRLMRLETTTYFPSCLSFYAKMKTAQTLGQSVVLRAH